MTAFRPVDERTVFEGYVLKVAVGTFVGPDGNRFERDVIRHPGAVAALPLDGDDVILVRQYRSAIDAHILEIPAGIRDVPEEPPAETARRELIEEIGMDPGRLEPLTAFHNAVGYCDELIHIFVATELAPVVRAPTDSPEENDMTIVRLPLSAAVSQVQAGEITDAKTIISLLSVASER